MSVDVEVCNGVDGKSSPEGILGAPKGCLEFVVYGRIMPKERPRVVRGRVYTPKRTKDSEENIGFAYKIAHHGKRFERGVPLRLSADFFFVGPKSSKKKAAQMLSGEIRPTKRGPGDADNLLKTVADALNGVAYEDDSQIVEVEARKYFGEEYKTVIRIEEVGVGAE